MTLQSSSLGRGGHRDDRRRRLLSEDRTASPATPESDQPADDLSAPLAHKSDHYGDAVFLQTQIRLTDLVPQRPLYLALMLLVGMAATAGLAMLYVYGPTIFPAANGRPIMADLGAPGSLGNWVASLLLIAASFLAIITYMIRRHKVDDYRGRYRVWLWAAACGFLMASDAGASLHQGIQQAIGSIAPMRPLANHPMWWFLPAVLALGTVGTRLFLDMRPCRLSSITLLVAAVAYSAAVMAFFQVVRLPGTIGDALLLHSSLLTGHLLLAWSMAVHARYVLMDAEGRLPRPATKPRAKRPRAAEPKVQAAEATRLGQPDARTKAESRISSDDGDDRWLAVDPPHEGGIDSRPALLKRVNSAETASAPALVQEQASFSADSSDGALGLTDGKLSKADRKALKKKLLDERLKAEQRKASNW